MKLADTDIRDNIKEFAQIDGVFVISEDGVVEAAGRYITIDTGKVRISGGWEPDIHRSPQLLRRQTPLVSWSPERGNYQNIQMREDSSNNKALDIHIRNIHVIYRPLDIKIPGYRRILLHRNTSGFHT